MRNKKITKEWIEKAEKDFGFASSSLRFSNYFAQICFHFQRSAEKYLKAFMIAHGLEFRPVPNLIELLEICKQKEPKIEEIEKSYRYLNPFYIDTRYPVHWPTRYDKETALKAKESVEKMRDWIRGVLKF